MRDLAQIHAEYQQHDETEVHERHGPALRNGHLEIATLFLALAFEERQQARNGKHQYEDEHEIGMHDREGEQNHESDEPQPRRKGGYNAAAIEKANRGKIEQIEKNPV